MENFISADDGVNIHYSLSDYTEPWADQKAETFILHHGAWRNMHFFRTWVPLLATSYRVLRIDARGSGSSDKNAAEYTIARFAKDAVAVMDHLEIETAHWIGESSGGMVGIQIAADYPERLLSLSLCNTPIKRRTQIGAAYTLGEDSQEAALKRYGVREFCNKTMKFRIDMNRANQSMIEWILNEMEKTSAQAAVALHKDIGLQDFSRVLADLHVPILMLVSSDSQIAGKNQVNEMREIVPDAEIRIFEGIGHGLNLFEYKWCAENIIDFVDGLTSQKESNGTR